LQGAQFILAGPLDRFQVCGAGVLHRHGASSPESSGTSPGTTGLPLMR
jgi:hypothetical protein